MKRIAAIIVMLISVFTLCISASAKSDIGLYDVSGYGKSSTLSISGTTANCTSSFNTVANTTKSVSIEQTLEIYYKWIGFCDITKSL